MPKPPRRPAKGRPRQRDLASGGLRPPASRPALLGQAARADLLLALARGARQGAGTAALLGYHLRPDAPAVAPGPRKARPPAQPPAQAPAAATGEQTDSDQPPAAPKILPPGSSATPFWLPERSESRQAAAQREPQPEDPPVDRTPRASAPPPAPLLAPWRELRTRLQPRLARRTEGRALDTDRLVSWIGQGRQIRRLPRRLQRRRHPRILVLVDRSEHLVPYWHDQEDLLARLLRDATPATLRLLAIDETRAAPCFDAAAAGSLLPAAGGLCLLLGDLGCLLGPDPALVQRWRACARRLRQAGVRPLALLPCAPERCPRPLRAAWDVHAWERPRGPAGAADTAPTTDALAQLLTLLAPAIRLEPGLVRAQRRRLGAGRTDPGLESDLWQHPDIAGMHCDGATWDEDRLGPWRERFEALDADARGAALEVQARWRRHHPGEVWFEELLSLAPATRALPAVRDDAADAGRFYVQLSRDLRGARAGLDPGRARRWFRRSRARLSDQAYRGDTAEALHRLSLFWDADDRRTARRPAYDPAYRETDPAHEHRLLVHQCAAGLTLAASTGASPVALLRCGYPEVQLLWAPEAEPVPPPDPGRDPAFWDSGEPPPWADTWGEDAHGPWVEIVVAPATGPAVRQRLRWIPPGRFMMGSPDTEVGRFSDEGPRHEVRIEQGYWLFDTPVTQALWTAVLGDNPSYFQGPDRPVEQVEWDDTQRFLEALNARLPGLDLSLPSEAQWEFACRAGSRERWCFGDDEARLAEFAWYAENAGDETYPVGQKQPNALGLYDMHGNVWEWVQDLWHGSYEGAPGDGSAWESSEVGADRVIRGGSRGSVAQDCRSAYRYNGPPDLRGNVLGFRCARVQARELSPDQSGQDERSAASRPGVGPRSGWGRPRSGSRRGAGAVAEHTGDAADTAPDAVGRISEAHPPQLADPPNPPQPHVTAGPTTLRLGEPTPAALPLPPVAPTLMLRTDREQLALRRLHRPGWAEAVGRDRFGLWAEIRVESSNTAPVTQRLRWIPPGRFTMGSPESEPGRWDAEGPQHEVRIAQGYWLFDTPCTQALWEAVLGDHESRFRDPNRPVENVDWDAAQRFAQALHERLAALDDDGGRIVLPSEAQWEYACRAGSDTALYTGALEILGANNAPCLDPIAWYGGNSGEGYELEEGHDSSDWPEMQYANPKSGTRRVGQKATNPWGLYDMLGNVWEWTEDHWHHSYEGAPPDGSAWTEDSTAGADRVFRGGSWVSDAQDCRSACRDYGRPDYRYDYLGFRCARVQDP